jgi:hypothetical protein
MYMDRSSSLLNSPGRVLLDANSDDIFLVNLHMEWLVHTTSFDFSSNSSR